MNMPRAERWVLANGSTHQGSKCSCRWRVHCRLAKGQTGSRQCRGWCTSCRAEIKLVCNPGSDPPGLQGSNGCTIMAVGPWGDDSMAVAASLSQGYL